MYHVPNTAAWLLMRGMVWWVQLNVYWWQAKGNDHFSAANLSNFNWGSSHYMLVFSGDEGERERWGERGRGRGKVRRGREGGIGSKREDEGKRGERKSRRRKRWWDKEMEWDRRRYATCTWESLWVAYCYSNARTELWQLTTSIYEYGWVMM